MRLSNFEKEKRKFIEKITKYLGKQLSLFEKKAKKLNVKKGK